MPVRSKQRPAKTLGGVLSRIATRWLSPILDRIDRGLENGRLDLTMPGGSTRVLGGQAPGPVATVALHRWRGLLRLARSGSVGWYEAWQAGEWSSPDPVELFDLFVRNRVALGNVARGQGTARFLNRLRHFLRDNDRVRARKNIHAHYDLGNDFYAKWLDPTMTYSSAIFEHEGDDLEQAQRHKIACIIKRLDALPGATALEIGFGWGALSRAMAEMGLAVTAISLSEEQLAHARASNDAVDWRLTDYRDVDQQFDAIASVEMLEAVGERYWPQFADMLKRCLKPGGRAALQFISIADDIFERYAANADFIQTYVFPGGMLLSTSRFRALVEARGLRWTDQQDFGPSYAETLRQWRNRFEAAVAAERLPPRFDRRFVDLWRYYLMYCEGGFRGGGITVSQVTLAKP